MIENNAAITPNPPATTFSSTGKTLMQLDIARKGVLETMKTPANLSVESGITHATKIEASKMIQNPFPVVVLVSGAGGNGKDTFIDIVGRFCSAMNLSSITEIKEVAEVLVNYTKDIEDEMEVCPGKHQEMKTDRYRQFLHALKMAWADFCDGPNYRLISELRNVLTEQITGGARYDVIFLHVREATEIDKMKTTIENKFGLICLTMIVKGLVDSSDYVNDCDSNVDNYTYDLTIVNTPNKLTMFELQAMLFATNLKYANQVFGIESKSALYDVNITEAPSVTVTTGTAPEYPTAGPAMTVVDNGNVTADVTAKNNGSGDVGFHPDFNTPDIT